MDGAVGSVSVLINQLSLLNPRRLQIQTHLLDHHVRLLFGHLRVGMRPSVGQRELQSIVGVLQLQPHS